VGQKISKDAAADTLGVNKRTIERLIASEELPAYRIGTKLVRVDADDVAKLLKPINGAAAGNGGAA
jgi:excisionase family DNA binding protein